MSIIGMSRRFLAKVAELAITIKEEMLVRRRNIARHCQDSDSDEYDELDNEQFKPKRKGAKVWFDAYRRGVYCQNYYNKGHFTKECKLLIKKFQICKSDNHNTDQCPNKSVGGSCPTREIVPVHVVQVETLLIQKNKKQNYEISSNEKGYGNQSYN